MHFTHRVLSTLFSTCVFAAAQAPSITYPAPSLPAIKLGDPLPESLSPTNSGGAVPAIPYRRVETFAGSGSAGGTNATGTAASFNGPWGISRDAHGNLYVADFAGKRIRKVTPSGVVSLIDEFGSFEPIATAVDPATGHLYCCIATHRILRYVNKNAANYPAQEPVYGPETNFADAVIVYVGTNSSGTTDASGTSARLNAPHSLAVRDGFLYVADKGNNRIRKVNLDTAAVETVTFTGGTLDGPEGIVIAPDGSLYVANTGGSDLIQKIESGVIRTYAGSGSGYANGMAAYAKFDNPRGLALDAEGNLLVAEGNNNAIRRISPDGWVTPLAGSTNGGYDASKGYADGIGDEARFNSARGLVLGADGLLYITDNSNHRIRRLCLTGYEIDPPLPAGLAFDTATGVISGTATELTPEGGALFPHYQNSFQSGTGSAALHGAANRTIYNKIQLTPASASQSGGIAIPAGKLNVQQLEVSFLLETGKPTGGGQGLSYNFGEAVEDAFKANAYADIGFGSQLSLVFDPFGESGTGVKGVRLLYGTKYLNPGVTPGVNGVLAYSPTVSWAGGSTAVVLTIDALSRVSVTLDGQSVFSDIPLPAAYTAADKSSWTHAIAARTDAAANDAFTIDDLSILQSSEDSALYRVTARNSSGSATAPVRINIKESPRLEFNLQSVLKEDAETGLYTPSGRDWEALPAVGSSNETLGPIAGDVNARKLLVVKTNPAALIHQRTLHLYNPVAGAWTIVNGSLGTPLYGRWSAVAASADASVLVAVGQPESSTNAYGAGSQGFGAGANLDTPGKLAWSTDGGTTWQTRPVGSSGAWEGRDVAVSADGNTIYVGTVQRDNEGYVSNMSPGALLVSRNRGSSWGELYPGGSPYLVEEVSCDASGKVVVLNAVIPDVPGGVATTFNNVLVSTDSGASWVNRTSATGWTMRSGVEVAVTADGKSIFGKPTDYGQLYVSNDLGATWRNTYSGPSTQDNAFNCYGFAVSSTGKRVAQFNGNFRMVMSEDGAQTFVSYQFTPSVSNNEHLRHIISNHSGRRLVIAYRNNVHVSQGGGLELEHTRGDSQVLTVTLGAPQGLLRVTALAGVTVVGNGTGTLSLTGPLGLINSILESLTYQGGADFTGTGGFSITAESSGVSTNQTNQVTVQDAAQPQMAAAPTSTAITETAATLGGSVTGNGGSALTRRGVVVSATATNAAPVIGGNGVIDLVASGTTLGAFTVNAPALTADTAYSFRAYAINANGPQYSDLGTFSTPGATVPLVLVVGTGLNKVASISISKLQSRAGVLAGQAVALASTDPSSTAGGTVAIFGTTLRYTPATGYSGTDSFEVVFNQIGGGTFTGRVDVTISAASGGRVANLPQIIPVAGGGMQVNFRAIPGVTYKVQRSTDLQNWQEIGTTTAGSTGDIQYTDLNPPSPSGYYRLAQP